MEGKYGLVDDKGNTLVPPICDEVNFADGFAFIKKNGMYGVFKNGEEVIPFEYNGFYGYKNGEILVSRPLTEKELKQKEKLKQDAGEDEYEEYDNGENNNYEEQGIKIEGKFGLIDTTGTIVIKFKYDDAYFIGEKLITVKYKGKYGVINMSNKQILAFNYDKIYPLEEGNGEAFLKTKLEHKFGCIDLSGNEIAKPIYDEINLSFSENGFVIITKDEKKGCINKDGKLILPIEYDEITVYDENSFMVYKDDESFMVDSNNKRK